MSFRHVVLDFDGTCTRVEDVASAYVDHCLHIFETEVQSGSEPRLRAALAGVLEASPKAGWMLSGTPSAPAGADPYIHVGEAIRRFVKEAKITKHVPDDLHARANDLAEAPWRAEMIEVLEAFRAKDVVVHFVSNSKTTKIERRLDELLAGKEALRRSITVLGDAGKFRIREIEADASLPTSMERLFTELPAAEPELVDGRPVYLRRGGYFEALSTVWGHENRADRTLVCGDIWELDLAMPTVLGAHVHLVEREAPYGTYDYEKRSIERLGRRASFGSLRDVIARL